MLSEAGLLTNHSRGNVPIVDEDAWRLAPQRM